MYAPTPTDTRHQRLLAAMLVAASCKPPTPPPPPSAPESIDLVDREPSTSTAPPEELRIATWNIRRLGHADSDLDRIAGVLDDYDLVAVQEVMTREVVDALLARMPAHRSVLTDSPRPLEGSHREYYLFLYRPAVFDPHLNATVPDPDDRFVREPFVGCFDFVRGPGRLCLLTIHVVFGERVDERRREIAELGRALAWAQQDMDASWIVLGDFNRPVDDGDRDDQPEAEWTALLDRAQLRAPVAPVGPETPTTLGQADYANAYDHVFLSDDLVPKVTAAGRRDIVAEICDRSFETCKAAISDHAPYELTLEFGR